MKLVKQYENPFSSRQPIRQTSDLSMETIEPIWKNTRYHTWAFEQLEDLNILSGPFDPIEKQKIELCRQILQNEQKKLEAFVQEKKTTDVAYVARLAAIHEWQAEQRMGRLSLILSKPSVEELWKLMETWESKRLSLFNLSGRGTPKDIEYLDPSFKYDQYGELEIFRWNFSYQLPWRENIETIKRLSRGQRVLEICAGLGLWGCLLAAAGVNIVCTDSYGWSDYSISFYPVEQVNWVDAVQRYPSDVLLMIWPPSGKSKTLLEAVKAFQGNHVILIGEIGGLTGGTDVTDYLENEFDNNGYESYRVHNPKYFDDLRMFHWNRSNHLPLTPVDE